MKFKLLITFCLLIPFLSITAQETDSGCVKVTHFPISERNKNYPFNEAKKIVFASFKESFKKRLKIKNQDYKENEIIGIIEGKMMQEYFDSLKIDFSRYNPEYFEEQVELNNEQKNKLTDLIYNYGTNQENSDMWAAKCYIPRNAILFFDDSNKLIGFIELCFECNNYRTSSSDISININCDDKMILLKHQFEKAGIEYGVKTDL